MLYVFCVDTGTMYKFSMELSMQPVSRLKEAIAKHCHVPVDKQVLLISGGEPLSRDKLVCSYSAGTDTNPIFLFCKSAIEGAVPPSPSIYHGSDVDLTSQVEGSLIMPPAFDTVVQRTQLAMQIYEIDTEELKACERLVLDQHLQQQGWAAVVANLEDLVSAFGQRARLFQKEFCQYIATREDILTLLRRIPETLVLLERIPVLPCLEIMKDIATTSQSQLALGTQLPATRKTTLYSWINSQDPKNRMEDVINNLSTGTTQMNEALEEKVAGEVRDATNYIQAPEMKEVKGLEDRLYGLDQLMSSARKLLEEQRHMAQGFHQNQTRLSDLKDNSILPDLCSSHKRQLTQMLSNHKKLRDIKRKCTAAKEELSANLHTRLRWVMYVQRTVNSMDNKLWLYHDNLDRIKTRAGLLRQVETAPQAYASMILEVLQRCLFSQHYLKWAAEVSQESRRQHKKETQRRKSFTRQYGSHFLQKMFTGFRDNVPKFATEPPKEFDGLLPSITPADISAVGQAVPELRHLLRLPSDTGSPGMASSFQHPLAADGGSEPQPTAVTQSMISVSQSVTSTVHSVSGSLEGQDVLGVLLFEPAEQDHPSLSYQGEERQGERRMSVDDRLALSLQEQFTVPECLSETLTAEVNSAAMSTITVSVMSSSPQTGEVIGALGGGPGQQRQPQQEGSGDGQLLSSGDQEPNKSSDSDAVSHESLSERKPRSKRRGKGASDTSPDVETSQEFTTADFYIEDSMPSSMTDSPPKPSTSSKEQSEVDSVLVEKSRQVNELEMEVSALQSRLAASEEKCAGLQSLLNKDLEVLKQSVASMREAVMDSHSSTVTTISTVQESILNVCASFVEEMERHQNEVLNQERDSCQVTISSLESQLVAKNKHIEDLQQGMLKVSSGIADLNKELQQVRESSQRELAVLQEKHEVELAEITSRSMLEMELEADRVRTEMQVAMDKQEVDIACLEEQLHAAEFQLQQVLREKEVRSEELVRGFVEEKQKMSQTLEEEFAASKQRELEELKVRLDTQHEQELDAVHQDLQDKMDTMCKQMNEDKQAEIQKVREEIEEIQKVREEMEVEIQKVREEMEVERNRCVKEAEERVTCEHKAKLEHLLEENQTKAAETISQLRAEFEAECNRTQAELQSLNQRPLTSEQETQSEGGEVMTLEHHKELVTQVERGVMQHHQELVMEAERAVKLEVTLQYQQALEDQRHELEAKMEEMARKHQKDKDESMAAMKTSVMAERQVQFNAAVSRAVQDKDRTIEELRNRVQELESHASRKETEGEESIRKQLVEVKERESSLLRDKWHLEDEVALLQQQLNQYSEQLHSMATSTAPISPTVMSNTLPIAPPSVALLRANSGGVMEESIAKTSDWEQIANMREHRIAELESKLMTMSMTASTRKEARDKVSILSCCVGDLVLLCLDDRHDQYVVFTVGNTLHFLHSDSVESLGLKPVEGEPRKNWVLAEVTEREYCQARKPQNRFKVPVGTKFYRVKAKPWNPGGSSG